MKTAVIDKADANQNRSVSMCSWMVSWLLLFQFDSIVSSTAEKGWAKHSEKLMALWSWRRKEGFLLGSAFCGYWFPRELEGGILNGAYLMELGIVELVEIEKRPF